MSSRTCASVHRPRHVLGNADDETDARYTAAVVRAVELGANVIDTAANYRFQRSERAIGNALRELTEVRGFARDELVVCTKGGYLPFDGAPPRDIRRYLEETFVSTGVAGLADFAGGSHCMTPRYLQHQLQQSLRNMNLECTDVYYIHNPESQLGHVSAAEFTCDCELPLSHLNKVGRQGNCSFMELRPGTDFEFQQQIVGIIHSRG